MEWKSRVVRLLVLGTLVFSCVYLANCFSGVRETDTVVNAAQKPSATQDGYLFSCGGGDNVVNCVLYDPATDQIVKFFSVNSQSGAEQCDLRVNLCDMTPEGATEPAQ